MSVSTIAVLLLFIHFLFARTVLEPNFYKIGIQNVFDCAAILEIY
jgi:hypothetical protein